MAAFDQKITIHAARDTVAQEIKRQIKSDEQLITIREGMLFVALRRDMGYVYVLQAQPDGSVVLRLLVDAASSVRAAFRGRSPKEALMTLVSALSDLDSGAQSTLAVETSWHLNALKQAAETAPSASVFTLTQEPASAVKKSESPASTPGPVLTKKPLPGTTGPQLGKPPWDPSQIIGYTFFLTLIGAGILYAINWRRLGKPTWMWPTIGLSILVPVFVILIVLGMVRLSPEKPITIGLISLVIGLNFGWMWGLRALQNGAYRKYANGDVEAMYRHRYDFTRAVSIALLTTIGFAVLAGGYAFLTSRPNTFENEELTITYPSTWAKHNTADLPNCQGADFECIMAVADARFGFTSILFGKYSLPQPMTLNQIHEATWDYYKDEPSAQLLSVEDFEIDGIPAIRRFYRYPAQDDLAYVMQIYFVRANSVYELTVSSPNPGIFQEEQHNIDEFIAGIKFK